MGFAEVIGYSMRGMTARATSPSVPLYVNSQLFLLLGEK